MKSVEEIAAEIVAREGGYIDDPDDPGGATKHGVTIGTLRRGLRGQSMSKSQADGRARLVHAPRFVRAHRHLLPEPRTAASRARASEALLAGDGLARKRRERLEALRTCRARSVAACRLVEKGGLGRAAARHRGPFTGRCRLTGRGPRSGGAVEPRSML